MVEKIWREKIGIESTKSVTRNARPARARIRSATLCSAAILATLVCLVGACVTKKERAPNPTAARYRGVEALDAIDAYIAEHPVDKSDETWRTHVPRPPFVRFDPARSYYWTLHTSLGRIRILLLPEVAPRHVSSTLYLTRLGFYEGLPFHRIIPEFMVQGGDPLGDGTGGPGFRLAGEFKIKRSHKKPGIVSMANHGPRTEGSQFFITFKAAEHLDGKHTIFGEVVEGLGTVRTMQIYGSKDGKPTRTILLQRAEIEVKN